MALSLRLEELSKKKLQANFGTGCVTLNNSDILRVLAAYECEDRVTVPLKNLLLKMIVQTEHESGGSAFIALRVCLEIIINISKAQQCGADLRYLKTYSMKPILTHISHYSRVTTEQDVEEILKNSIGDDLVSALICTAANEAGPGGHIFIDEKCNTTTHVELKSGYNFKCSLVPTFAVATGIQVWEHTGVRCVIIDGIIESVAEIHHLLEALNKLQVPAMICARGFSQEVLATLSTNKLRGTLNAVPVIVGYTVAHLNMLKDIATACSTDVVSALKGELISSIDLTEAPVIDKIKVTLNQVIISHRKSENIVKLHIKNLKKQKQELEDSKQYVVVKNEKAKLIDERIKALSSNYANIALGPDLKIKKGIIHDRLKNAIMVLRESAHFGKIATEDIQLAIAANIDRHNPIDAALSTSIAKIKKTVSVMSISSVLTGIQRGAEYALAISSIGAILLESE